MAQTRGVDENSDFRYKAAPISSPFGTRSGTIEPIMLKSVRITNFKSCHNTRLDDLGNLTVLVGRNGAGKSNILQTVNWVARAASSPAQLVTSPTGHCAATLEFSIDGAAYRFTISIKALDALTVEEHLQEQTDDGWKKILTRKNNDVKLEDRPDAISIQLTTSSIIAVSALLPKDDPVHLQLDPILSFFSSIRYYPLDESIGTRNDFGGGDVVSESAYAQWLHEFKTTSRAKDDVNTKFLHMWLTSPDQFDEVKSILGPNGLGLIDDIFLAKFPQVQKPQSKQESQVFYYIAYTPSGAHPAERQPGFSYYDLSHGTRRVLRMVVSIIFDTSAVMLLEHPEDGIHSGLLQKVFDVIKSYSQSSQAIVASHSADVFNMVDPSEVRFVSMMDGATSVRPLSDTELTAAAKFVNSDGPLSEFLESLQE